MACSLCRKHERRMWGVDVVVDRDNQPVTHWLCASCVNVLAGPFYCQAEGCNMVVIPTIERFAVQSANGHNYHLPQALTACCDTCGHVSGFGSQPGPSAKPGATKCNSQTEPSS